MPVTDAPRYDRLRTTSRGGARGHPTVVALELGGTGGGGGGV